RRVPLFPRLKDAREGADGACVSRFRGGVALRDGNRVASGGGKGVERDVGKRRDAILRARGGPDEGQGHQSERAAPRGDTCEGGCTQHPAIGPEPDRRITTSRDGRAV